MFAFIAGLLNAVPILDKWVTAFVAYYLQWESKYKRDKFKRAVVEAIKNRDQRELESAEISGKPSGHEGVEVRERT